jgi:hypothetical protein
MLSVAMPIVTKRRIVNLNVVILRIGVLSVLMMSVIILSVGLSVIAQSLAILRCGYVDSHFNGFGYNG